MIDRLLNILLVWITEIVWRRHCKKYEGVCCECIYCYETKDGDYECELHDVWASGIAEQSQWQKSKGEMS